MARLGGKTKHSYLHILLLLCFFLLMLACFSLSISALTKGNVDRQRESLERALERDITYCYASEGRYPQNLNEIVDRYQLTYDSDLFFVDYQVRGANIRPDVTVLVRNEEEAR